MKVLKKSALSLAVAGVVYGTAITPVYADVAVASGAQTLVNDTTPGFGDNTTISVADGVILTSGSGNNPALTIDVDKTGTNNEVLITDIVINGTLNGHKAADNIATVDGGGLFITTAASGDSLKGDITINGDVTAGTTENAISSAVNIDGNLTINAGKTVLTSGAGIAVDLQAIGASTNGAADAAISVNGSIDGGSAGTALKLGGAVTGAVVVGSAGSITSSGTGKTIDADVDVTVINNNSITGVIDVADGKTLTLTNNKTLTGNFATNSSGAVVLTNTKGATLEITGSLAGTGSLTVSNQSGGEINLSGTSHAVTTLENAAGAKIYLDEGTANVTLTVAEDFTNSGSIARKNDGNISTLTFTKKLTNAGTIDVDTVTSTLAFKNTGTIAATTLLDLDEDSSNEGQITAGGLNVADGKTFTNTGTIIMTGPTTASSPGAATIKNTGTVRFDGAFSTGTAAIDTTGGTLGLRLTNVNAAYTGAAPIGLGAATTVNSSSKIVISASEAALNAPRNDGAVANVGITTNGNLQYKVGSAAAVAYDADNKDHTLSISTDNVLLKLANVNFTDAAITADLSVMSAEDVVKGYGMSDPAQKVAARFHLDLSSLTNAAKKAIHQAYGSLVSNASSEASLKSYIDDVRPDDSNSAAMTGATVAHSVMGNIANRSSVVRTGVNSGDIQAAGGFWVQSLIGSSEQKARGNALAYDGDLHGITFGLDREFGDSTTGLAFSYGKSDVDFERDQSDEVKSYMASVYNIWQHGNMYVDSSLSFGGSKHESKRFNGTATAKYNSTQFGGQSKVGYYINTKNVMVEPMVAARLTTVNVNSVSYFDGDRSDEVSYLQMELGFGAAVSKAFEVGKGMLTPRLSAMYYHDFVGDELDTQLTFAGDNYTVKGASAVKNSWELGLGVSYAIGENLDLSAGYTRVMKNDFSSDNFNARLKYMF